MRAEDRVRLAEITSYGTECRLAFESAQGRTFEAMKAQIDAPLDGLEEARRLTDIARQREDNTRRLLFWALESENRRLRAWLERKLKEGDHDAE